MSYTFFSPHRIFSGKDSLTACISTLKGKVKHVLIVTDANMVKFGNCRYLEKELEKQNILYTIYDEINSEPLEDMVIEGRKLFRNNNCDGVIALGGGSPIDTAKIISAALFYDLPLNTLMGKNIETKHPLLIAVPTTAGTGSEATQFAIITDTKNDVKMLLKGSALMPDIAVIDPKFTLTAPPSVTANTGIDALTHAIEAFTSKKAQPLSDTFAISAIKKILNNLPKAYEDGHDIEARVNMSLAATEAGIAFNNSSVTLVHGMSRPIGALFHIAHGLSNAVLLIECIKFLSSDKASIARFAKLAKECAIVGETVDDHEAIAELIRVIESLYTKLKIPSLSSLIKEKDLFVTEIKKMTSDALQSGSPQNSLRDITEYDIENLYLKIISK